MTRECRLMPELHEPVLDFIKQVQQSQSAGAGQIALTQLIAMVQTELTPDELNMLGQRGDIILKKGDESGGMFENVGSALEMKVSQVTLKIPVRLSGTYMSSVDGFSFMFNDSETVVGKVLFFSTKLQDVRGDMHRLDVDLSGDAFDQCFIHG